MANDGSIAFGEPLVWMLTQPGASGKCRCRTSSHETNFKKVANSRGLEMHATEFLLSCRNPSCLSFHRILFVEPQFLWNVMWRPKQRSHHTLAMCGKEHPTRDPACATSTRVTFPWDFRRWISSHQWAQSKDWTAVKIARRLRRIFRTGVPWSETGYSMDNWQNCLEAFGKNQQAKSPRAVCALPEQTFCSVHQSASSCLHWHSKCLASDEPPDFRASTSACKRLASDRAASSSLANIICQSANLRISRHKQSYKRNRLCSTHR